MKKPKAVLAREWTTSLRIPSPNTSDLAPALDPNWCAAKGVNPAAPIILRLLRDQILPFSRELRRKSCARFHFLIHDRQSGVPAPDGDNSAFIHMRMRFFKEVDLHSILREKFEHFEFTRPIECDDGVVGGIDYSIVKGAQDGSAGQRVRDLLDAQSQWVLSLVEAHDWKDDADMVRQTRQIVHWMANMLQMTIG